MRVMKPRSVSLIDLALVIAAVIVLVFMLVLSVDGLLNSVLDHISTFTRTADDPCGPVVYDTDPNAPETAFPNELDPEETAFYLGPEPLPGVYGATDHPRSPQWRGVRDKFARAHPDCAFYKCSELTTKRQIHHLEPFHINPSRELDVTNLVSVCPKHHLYVCHNGNFQDYVEARLLKIMLSRGEFPVKGKELYLAHEAKRGVGGGRSSSKTIQAP